MNIIYPHQLKPSAMCPHHSPDLIQKSNNSKYFKSRTQDLKTAKTEWLMSF